MLLNNDGTSGIVIVAFVWTSAKCSFHVVRKHIGLQLYRRDNKGIIERAEKKVTNSFVYE